MRLRNITDAVTIYPGQSGNLTWSGSGISVGLNVPLTLKGRFVLAGTKVLEIQHWTNNSGSTGGTAASSGEDEVYADVMFWKTA